MATSKAKKEVKKEEEQLNLDSLAWGDLTWINIEKPTERETEYLAQNYPFHPLDLDDCLSRIQRPKIDEYKDYLFLVFHFPVFNKEARVTASSQVSVFIGKDYLITLHKGELKPLVKLFRECQIDEESRQENFSYGSGYLLYRIVDRLVDYCLPILNRIGDNIERTEDDIFASRRMPRAIEKISILTLTSSNNWCKDFNFCTGRQFHDCIDNLVGSLRMDFPAAFVAIGNTDTSKEYPQIIIDFGYSTHG